LPVDVFGYRWERFLGASPNLQINDQIVGEAMLRTLRSYRIQLNFFRPHNADSHNMRTFEVPACGGIMLAEDSIEHREFYENNKEAFYFRTHREMAELARHLLALPKCEAEAIRGAARRRSVVSGYSYHDRALQALAAISAVHAIHAAGKSAEDVTSTSHRFQ
jgi:spore maturation protein CgeB